MPAARSRGSRIRSPSWRNELIKKDIRQKARQFRAFFIFYLVALARHLEQFPFVRCFDLGDSVVCRLARLGSLGPTTIGLMPVIDRAGFGNSNRDGVAPSRRASGLPCSDEQKKTRLHSHLSA
jgi:hypothetical protein